MMAIGPSNKVGCGVLWGGVGGVVQVGGEGWGWVSKGGGVLGGQVGVSGWVW